MYGLVLIAVLAIMGGIIAYIGDKLGSKVGKRKLTMFGLRPKHTSILVTIITGIIIAASTLGVMSVASRDVRTALFGMEALKAELSSLSQEVASKNIELDASRSALETKTKEYSALTSKINETIANLNKVSSELAAVTEERNRTAAELDRVQRDFASAQGDLDRSKQEIANLQTTKDELDSRVASLNDSKIQLQGDIDRLNELTANLSKGLQIVREGVVVYRAGEVLSTNVFRNGRPKEEVEAALTQAISETNQSIIAKLGVSDKNLEVLWVGRADFDRAVQNIISAPEDVIVRISSAGNTIYGEPVIGGIEIFPNRLVYSAGTVVLSRQESIGSAKQAEEMVFGFLQQVNMAAIKQGILPDPLQGTVGVISGSQFYDTVNKVKRYSGKVELTAVAKTDIYTVGPLQIEIRVQGNN
jgi:uncharacterized protein (DUF3084 family)